MTEYNHPGSDAEILSSHWCKMFNLAIDNEICVRTFHPDDAEELFQLLEQNRARLRPWIHPSALPETAKATRLYAIECYFNSLGDPMEALASPYFSEVGRYFRDLDPPLEMGIWLNGNLSGEVALSRLKDSPTAAEFGYWIAQACEGRGIITRCVAALMDHAVDCMGIERFLIGCAVSNQRSRAVAERLGYRFFATVPCGEAVGEYVYDRVLYGMRSTVWRDGNRKQKVKSSSY